MECEFFRLVGEEVRKRGACFDYQDFDTRFYSKANRLERSLLYRTLGMNCLEEIRDKMVSRSPAVNARIAHWLQQNEAFINSILEVSGKRVFLDAAKDPCRIMYLRRIPGVNYGVIQMIRDPRGYVNSSRKNRNRAALGSVLNWVRTHHDIERRTKRFSIPRLVVRYEDLCRDPLAELNRICDFFGLSEMNEYEFAPRKLHLIGNRMRLRDALEISPDFSWQTALPENTKRLTVFCAGRMMKRYGYID